MPGRDPLATMEDEARQLIATRKQAVRRDRSWDSKRTRMTYDLPRATIQRVTAVAESLKKDWPDVRIGDVACIMLEAAANLYEGGHWEILVSPRVSRGKIEASADVASDSKKKGKRSQATAKPG